jgi:hypothetical protein
MLLDEAYVCDDDGVNGRCNSRPLLFSCVLIEAIENACRRLSRERPNAIVQDLAEKMKSVHKRLFC